MGTRLKRSSLKRTSFKAKRSPIRYKAPREDSTRDLESQLDALTRKIVVRDAKICFSCGQGPREGDPFENGHLFTRTWRSTRWEVNQLIRGANCQPQHRSCNQAHEAHPGPYTRSYIEHFGAQAYVELSRRAASHHKFTFIELLEMIEEREALVSQGGQ